LFVTCLVDLMRPSVGFAAAKLIELSGCDVHVPKGQTCCGQPAYNSGDRETAKALASQTIKAFETCDYVVAPSGSCAGMLKVHYPELLEHTPDSGAARSFSARVYELTDFLVNVRKISAVPGHYQGSITYHDSCSGLRELGVKAAPRQLLGMIEGLSINEMIEAETCCGFGGLFSVKFPDISNAIVSKKASNAANADAGLVLGGDLGCLMNIAGKLKRGGSPLAVRHVAEVLVGEMDAPPIGQAE
jgi:L-lactate dehydrogenase complex protein LldE